MGDTTATERAGLQCLLVRAEAVVEVGRGWGRTEKSAAELVAAMLSLSR
jgi:hypothetical protein